MFFQCFLPLNFFFERKMFRIEYRRGKTVYQKAGTYVEIFLLVLIGYTLYIQSYREKKTHYRSINNFSVSLRICKRKRIRIHVLPKLLLSFRPNSPGRSQIGLPQIIYIRSFGTAGHIVVWNCIPRSKSKRNPRATRTQQRDVSAAMMLNTRVGTGPRLGYTTRAHGIVVVFRTRA